MKHRTAGLVFIGLMAISLAALSSAGLAQILASHDEASQWAEQTLAKLTLEKKIGQMICAEIAGGYIADDDPKLQQWIRLARDYGVGGFVLYGGTPRDVARLLNRLQ